MVIQTSHRSYGRLFGTLYGSSESWPIVDVMAFDHVEKIQLEIYIFRIRFDWKLSRNNKVAKSGTFPVYAQRGRLSIDEVHQVTLEGPHGRSPRLGSDTVIRQRRMRSWKEVLVPCEHFRASK